MSAIPPLEWVRLDEDTWHDLSGRYVILRSTLPEGKPDPTVVYTLRKRDPASARVDPATLGYHLAERYSLTEARAEAERDAWSCAQGAGRHVPADYPCLVLVRFHWPISDGCTQAGLAIVRENGKVYVRVVGMSRQADDNYGPGTYAQIEIVDDMANPLAERRDEKP